MTNQESAQTTALPPGGLQFQEASVMLQKLSTAHEVLGFPSLNAYLQSISQTLSEGINQVTAARITAEAKAVEVSDQSARIAELEASQQTFFEVYQAAAQVLVGFREATKEGRPSKSAINEILAPLSALVVAGS